MQELGTFKDLKTALREAVRCLDVLVGNYAVTKERGHRNIVMKLMNYMDVNIGEL